MSADVAAARLRVRLCPDSVKAIEQLRVTMGVLKTPVRGLLGILSVESAHE